MAEERNAIFAGGCFWCMEPPFVALPGVHQVLPGYTGGSVPHPSYEQVCTGGTGHVEAVRIAYDPDAVSYESLLEVFWAQIDPTDGGGQFADRGEQYQTAIFYTDETERVAALQSLRRAEESGLYDAPIRTKILPAKPFYPAEDYHREYYRTHPTRYQLYKHGSGRQGYQEAMERKREEQNHETE